MKYENIRQGIFLERPNRFIALVEISGTVERVHVKNTGRCRELLLPGATVYLQEFGESEKRKTRYDLIAVVKEIRDGSLLINMDSQAPNKVVEEALRDGIMKLPGLGELPLTIQREKQYGDSRFDIYLENQEQKAFVEIKGATLEEDGVVRFPDAPTIRGLKHVNELIKAKKEGFLAYVIFVVQMEEAVFFEPNEVTHQAFGDALRNAQNQGVEILAYDCTVTPQELRIKDWVSVRL